MASKAETWMGSDPMISRSHLFSCKAVFCLMMCTVLTTFESYICVCIPIRTYKIVYITLFDESLEIACVISVINLYFMYQIAIKWPIYLNVFLILLRIKFFSPYSNTYMQIIKIMWQPKRDFCSFHFKLPWRVISYANILLVKQRFRAKNNETWKQHKCGCCDGN